MNNNEEKTEVLEVVENSVPKVETVAQKEEVPASAQPAPANNAVVPSTPQPVPSQPAAPTPTSQPAPAKVETPKPKQPLPEEPRKGGKFRIFLSYCQINNNFFS